MTKQGKGRKPEKYCKESKDERPVMEPSGEGSGNNHQILKKTAAKYVGSTKGKSKLTCTGDTEDHL